MIGVELLGVAATALISLGAWESAAHRRRLARIPCRIHVSGTRGKSSLTRLIAAGLRHHGVTTAAKTTGTLPRMILPDGRELPVFRPAGPNIIEQIRIVSAAHALGAQALVLECMALQPELHWLTEHKLVRATHGVITNVRADHLDVMGPTVADVGRALAGMIPVGGVLITAEREHLQILREAAADRGTRLVTVEDEDLEAVGADDLARFSYTEHRENVALALKVLAELSVPRATALAGMWAADPDPGALTEAELNFFGRRIVFVNAFAANDPLSTERIWRLVRQRHADVQRTVALFNLRADRPSRTVQLACDTDFWREADRVALMGSGAYLFARMAAGRGIDASRFVYAEHPRVDEIFETIIGLCRETTLIVGMANIGGDGLALVRYFGNRAQLRGAVG
ncbi:MAG: poly-gamma-glutamate synthase PgsB [Proteobacteria bacterium]|nr:poly-gamma-glutamate synthase PgsB [Pseudomonadota bacterium]